MGGCDTDIWGVLRGMGGGRVGSEAWWHVECFDGRKNQLQPISQYLLTVDSHWRWLGRWFMAISGSGGHTRREGIARNPV